MHSFRTSLIHFLPCILLVAFLEMESPAVYAETNVWASLGPDGGWVYRIAIDPQHPSTLYVGGSTIFKTTDGGASWRPVNPGSPVGPSGALVIDPQNPTTLYAAGWGGVSKSTDGGVNWSSSALPDVDVRSLAIDPKNSNTLYAGYVGGVFKTTDGGATWTKISSPLAPEANFDALIIDPQNSNTLYAVTWVGLLKSTDGGVNWTRIDSGLTGSPPQTFAIDPQNPRTLYLGEGITYPDLTTKGGMFKSVDGGASWQNSGLPGVYSWAMTIDPQNPNTLYASTVGGIYKTTDGAASWTQMNSGLPTGSQRVVIDPQNAGTVYVASNGVFKTTDGGKNWKPINSGLHLTWISALVVDPQNSGTLFADSGSQLLKTTNGGKNWTSSSSGLPYTSPVVSLAIDPHGSGAIYAGTEEYEPPVPHSRVLKSTDGGANWKGVLDLGGTSPVSFAFDPQNRGTVYAAGNAGVFKSIDAGATWVSLFSRPSFWVRDLVIDPQNPSTLYAAGLGGILKSTDGGRNWEPADSGMTYIDPADNQIHPYFVTRLTIDPVAPNTLYANAIPTSDDYVDPQLFKSTDAGASWSVLTRPSCYVQDLAISRRNSSTLYAGTGCGVFMSTDGGTNWTSVNAGLTSLNVSVLAIDPQDRNTVYAGTGGGGVFAITFDPDLVVTDLQFDRTSIRAGESLTANISGRNLMTQTFFDVRFTSPGSNVSNVVLNWQKGVAASHGVPAGTVSGIWTIDGVRAHGIETDHTGSFFPVSATLTVFP